ncbi:hypothetical protein ABZV75_14610 [Streptomyces flaveolus]|uniref:hypothetical protein n=1 Tax=Streptomyces flaveolus TaxID=67297 RepID=UPI0033B4B88A
MTLLAVDLVCVPLGRVRPTYLLDAATQAGRLATWWRYGMAPGPRRVHGDAGCTVAR